MYLLDTVVFDGEWWLGWLLWLHRVFQPGVERRTGACQVGLGSGVVRPVSRSISCLV